jgi:hypothetical protein
LHRHPIDKGTVVSDSDIAPARPASRQPQPRTGRSVRQYLKQTIDNRKERRKKQREERQKRDRGVPPPPTFDFDALADGTHLTQRETAAVLRRSVSCLENWRKDPEHPLQWRYVAGRADYTVRAIREFRKGATTK